MTGYNAVPWLYGSCCSTCPTFSGGYFSPPRPMAGYLGVADHYGNTYTSVCGGAAVATSSPSTGYIGLASLEYYVK